MLDRATGELLSAEKFGTVTWAERAGLVDIAYQEIPFRHSNVAGGPRAFKFRPGDWNTDTDVQQRADASPGPRHCAEGHRSTDRRRR